MNDNFSLDGFTFKEIKSVNKQRPYSVRCLETLDEKDSAISCHDAAGLLKVLINLLRSLDKRKIRMKITLSKFLKKFFLDKKVKL